MSNWSYQLVLPVTPLRQPVASSVELAFERLLADIVGGRYLPGANLPAERELARQLGTSRPTLREALRRLGEWGLVSARRGSGITVRDRRDWAIDVLPAYLVHGASREGGPAVAALLRDLLAVRRLFLIDILRVVSSRFAPGALARARAAVDRAWSARHDASSYVRADFEVIREIVEAARFLPGLWLLNSLGGVYFQLAETLHGAGARASAPDDYRAENGRILDALERGDGAAAARIAEAYLSAHDETLLGALGASP
jgi:GntR family transcriptional regulator, transcriptional repressor for pyruvate dehydrogenase complex